MPVISQGVQLLSDVELPSTYRVHEGHVMLDKVLQLYWNAKVPNWQVKGQLLLSLIKPGPVKPPAGILSHAKQDGATVIPSVVRHAASLYCPTGQLDLATQSTHMLLLESYQVPFLHAHRH